jgi:hypothetical protein
VKFPIGGIVRELNFCAGAQNSAGIGETPIPTVIVWMEEDMLDMSIRLRLSPERHVFQVFNFYWRYLNV